MLDKRKIYIIFFSLFLFFVSCGPVEPDGNSPNEEGGVFALFQLTKAKPEFPLPNDLVKDFTTGLLNIPLDSASGVEREFFRYLNTLDGFPSESELEVSFSGPLAPSSISDKNVLVYDVTKGIPEKVIVKVSYKSDGSKGKIVISKDGGWSKGARYVIFVLGGNSGVKSKDGRPVYPSEEFKLVFSFSPLCSLSDNRIFDREKGQCVASSGRVKEGAIKCCELVLSADLLSYAERTFKGKESKYPKEAVISKAIEMGSILERVRSAYTSILKVAGLVGIKAENVAVAWAFSTVSLPEFRYDPKGGEIPYPNDLLRDPQKRKLSIPPAEGETSIVGKIRKGLNSLDGFGTQGNILFRYSGELNPKTVELGKSIFVFDLDKKVEFTELNIKIFSDEKVVVLEPTFPLREGARYGVAVVSGVGDGGRAARFGLATPSGERFVSPPFMGILKSDIPLVDKSGKSAFSKLDDQSAAIAEFQRLSLQPLFSILKSQKGISKRDVVLAWTFTTQTVSQQILKLREIAYKMLSKLDKGTPRWSGNLISDFSIVPKGVSTKSLGSWIPNGRFKSWLLLDEKGTKLFFEDPTKGKVTEVPFILTLPKGTPPPDGWPLVIFQHGLGRSKNDVLAIANNLAANGFASISFDVIYHGERSRCTSHHHCTTPKESGFCDLKTGLCKRGKLLDRNNDGTIDASGAYFLQIENPFSIRDNFLQYILDFSALIRSLERKAFSSFTVPGGKKLQFNLNRVYFLGISLGSVLGTTALATTSLINRAILNVPGAPLVRIIEESPNFKKLRDLIYSLTKVKRESYKGLLVQTNLQTIFERADAGNFGIFLKKSPLIDPIAGKKFEPKRVMVMLAGNDEVIPIKFGRYLARTIGISESELKLTTYPQQGHSFLLLPSPSNTAAATRAAQIQVLYFLKTGKICKPNPSAGTCR